MLRRPATSLTITSEDVAAYEDRRSREAIALDQQQRQQQQQQGGDATASGSPNAEDVLRRAREERIGVGRRRAPPGPASLDQATLLFPTFAFWSEEVRLL
ncbi:unnamed protein product [Clonostachys solani]|uniref:Anaphase-promoting complex, subunit CDC26 n=1 Tax=Clonostachys solani TaxID=160281 RepID=A0A9N9Z3I7_9HYPO|nr:unnamed protein product [Clonostachys solani]